MQEELQYALLCDLVERNRPDVMAGRTVPEPEETGPEEIGRSLLEIHKVFMVSEFMAGTPARCVRLGRLARFTQTLGWARSLHASRRITPIADAFRGGGIMARVWERRRRPGSDSACPSRSCRIPGPGLSQGRARVGPRCQWFGLGRRLASRTGRSCDRLKLGAGMCSPRANPHERTCSISRTMLRVMKRRGRRWA